MRMIRSMIALAALACSAMLATAAPASTPLEPEIVYALASADNATAPVEVSAAVLHDQIASREAGGFRSTSGLTAPKLASINGSTAGSHRVHVDPGRTQA